jgi:menaquinone-specific isochorismate synthase
VQSPGAVHYADGKLTGPDWQAVVAETVRRINAGGLDKVVLARQLLAIADNPVDPRWLVARLAAEYPSCWTYHVDGLVGATPEMLIRREAGLATSRVLAGTIRRSADANQDLALAAGLAQSGKDLQEHEFAVASVARALASYCSGMNVPDAPYVLELPNVLHLATDVTAVADPGASSLALAAALHPSAAVCGTPTETARATIAGLEQLDRDRYAGPVGWIDADGDGEWAIALRCGRIDPDEPRQIRLFAGCGIVAGSDPTAEHAESVAKLIPMRDALGG